MISDKDLHWVVLIIQLPLLLLNRIYINHRSSDFTLHSQEADRSSAEWFSMIWKFQVGFNGEVLIAGMARTTCSEKFSVNFIILRHRNTHAMIPLRVDLN